MPKKQRRTLIIVVGSAAAALLVGGLAWGAEAASGGGEADKPIYLSPTDAVDPEKVAAAEKERADNFGPLQEIRDKSEWATEQQVAATSENFAVSADGLTPLSDKERAALSSESRLVTYGEASAAVDGIGGDPDIAPDRPVWVTVVHGFISLSEQIAPGEGSPPQQSVADVYTMLYDASSGDLISYGTGVDGFATGAW